MSSNSVTTILATGTRYASTPISASINRKIDSYHVYFWANESDSLEPIRIHVLERRPTPNATKIWGGTLTEMIMNKKQGFLQKKRISSLRKRLLFGTSALVVLLVVAFTIYTNDYYRALPFAIPAMSDGSAIPDGEYDGFTIYGDSKHGTGLIFYPGGKVETSAYEPLFYGLA